jgi:hypothetical protein
VTENCSHEWRYTHGAYKDGEDTSSGRDITYSFYSCTKCGQTKVEKAYD